MATNSPFVQLVCSMYDAGRTEQEILEAAEIKCKTKIEMYKVENVIENFKKGIFKISNQEISLDEVETTQGANDGNPV